VLECLCGLAGAVTDMASARLVALLKSLRCSICVSLAASGMNSKYEMDMARNLRACHKLTSERDLSNSLPSKDSKQQLSSPVTPLQMQHPNWYDSVEQFSNVCLTLLQCRDERENSPVLHQFLREQTTLPKHFVLDSSFKALSTGKQSFLVLVEATRDAILKSAALLQQKNPQHMFRYVPQSPLEFLPILYLLCAKVLFLCFSDLEGAMYWSSRKGILGDRPCPSALNSLRLKLWQTEVFVLRAELHEHVGNLDAAAAHLIEASFLLRSLEPNASALNSIFSLHAVRIWYRCASPKLHSCLQDYHSDGDQIYNQSAELRDEVTKRVKVVIQVLNSLFALDNEDDEADCSGAVASPVKDDAKLAVLKFRYIGYYWDVEGLFSPTPSGGTRVMFQSHRTPLFNCALTARARESVRLANPGYESFYGNCGADGAMEGSRPLLLLHGAMNPSRAAQPGLMKAAKKDQIQTAEQEENVELASGALCYMDPVMFGHAFEVVRALRKRHCLAVLASCSSNNSCVDGGVDNAALLAFLAGAASCGVSSERCGEWAAATATATGAGAGAGAAGGSPPGPPSDAAALTNNENYGDAFDVSTPIGASQAITRALKGSASDLQSLSQKLGELLRILDDAAAAPGGSGSKGEAATCFATLDDEADCVLLGRIDACFGVFVLALPLNSFGQVAEQASETKQLGGKSKTVHQKELGAGAAALGAPRSLPPQSMRTLLRQWDEVSGKGKNTMKQGVLTDLGLGVEGDAETAHASTAAAAAAGGSKVSEAQKKAWWQARQDFDNAIDSSISDVQDAFGPWRVMFSSSTNRFQDKYSETLAHNCHTALQSHLATDIADKLLAKLLPWLGLVGCNISHCAGSGAQDSSSSSSSDVQARTMQLSDSEAALLLRQVLAAHLAAALAPTRTKKAELQVNLLPLAQDLLTAMRTSVGGASTALGDPQSTGTGKVDSGSESKHVVKHLSEEELSSLKITELRELLKQAGLSGTGRKADLVERLAPWYASQASHAPPSVSPGSRSQGRDESSASAVVTSPFGEKISPRGHVLLILDEQLQRLPIECMPCLRGTSCTRMPSFAVLLSLVNHATSSANAGARPRDSKAQLQQKGEGKGKGKGGAAPAKSRVVKAAVERCGSEEAPPAAHKAQDGEDDEWSPANSSWLEKSAKSCWYALDIEGNLPRTRATLQPFLDSYGDRWQWRKVVASVPAEASLQ
jgi:hypothetical protein